MCYPFGGQSIVGCSPNGLTSIYGPPPAPDPHPQSGDASLLSKLHGSAIFSWLLTLTQDPFGNRQLNKATGNRLRQSRRGRDAGSWSASLLGGARNDLIR